MDVNAAFLHADIKEEIYIRPLESFPLPKETNFFELKKALEVVLKNERVNYF